MIYNIIYNFTKCTGFKNNPTTYEGGYTEWIPMRARAVDGCFFEDGVKIGTFEVVYNGSFKSIDVITREVSADEDQKVINGEMSGITSDGKFISWRFKPSIQFTDTATFSIAASGTPVTPVQPVSVTNNVEHTTYNKEVNG